MCCQRVLWECAAAAGCHAMQEVSLHPARLCPLCNQSIKGCAVVPLNQVYQQDPWYWIRLDAAVDKC